MFVLSVWHYSNPKTLKKNRQPSLPSEHGYIAVLGGEEREEGRKEERERGRKEGRERERKRGRERKEGREEERGRKEGREREGGRERGRKRERKEERGSLKIQYYRYCLAQLGALPCFRHASSTEAGTEARPVR